MGLTEHIRPIHLYMAAFLVALLPVAYAVRKLSNQKRRNLAGFLGMGLVVVAGLALSTNTSARFAEKRLHMESPLNVTLGLVLEAIVLGLSFYAWAFSDKGATRAAYILVSAQAIGAVEVVRQEHENLGTALVRIVGPVMLAYGLHKLLGLEAKLGKIEIRSDGVLARWWRDRLKRLEGRLGIGSRGADAQAISRRNSQDRLVSLTTLGKPWYLSTRGYEKALMRAGDASFHGLDDSFESLGTELVITTRIDRMRAFRALPDRSESYVLRSLRPPEEDRGAPRPSVEGGEALTSGGAPGRTSGHGEDAPGAHLDGARAHLGRGEGEVDLRRLAFDLYFDLRGTGAAPSQNTFERAWRDAGYGLRTEGIRTLYKEVHAKVTGDNK